MKTKKMIAIIGVCPGYGHENDMPDFNFQELYKSEAQKMFEETGVYISVICKEASALYLKEWGCPEGGEDVYELMATANPIFIKEKEMKNWEKICLELMERLKIILKQSTVTVEFSDVDLFYLKKEEENEHECE